MFLRYVTFFFLVVLCKAAPSCPSGWSLFQDSCYLFVDENVPWTAAEVICRTMGGKIVEVETPAENDFLVQKMKADPGLENIWIGLTDFAAEGKWLWTSSQEVSEYFNWGPGEPDNLSPHERGQDCVYVRPDSSWDDEACFYTVVRHSVGCEREQTHKIMDGERPSDRQREKEGKTSCHALTVCACKNALCKHCLTRVCTYCDVCFGFARVQKCN